MGVSSVDIANRALQKLGDLTIRSFNDNTKASRLAQNSYDIIRRSELSAMVWNFALVRTALTYLVDGSGNPIVPNWGFGLTYQIPADCIHVYQVSDIFNGLSLHEYRNQDVREFVIEGDKLLTNMTGNASFSNVVVTPTPSTPVPLPILYVADVTDTSKFHPLFVEALACKLAMEWAETLTQSLPKRQKAEQEYNTTVAKARFINAVQNPPQPRPDNTWILSRVG